MLLVVCAVVWIHWGPDVRSRFTPFQKLTLVFIGVLAFGTLWGLIRSRVTASGDGLTVVNLYRSRRFDWAEVVGCTLRRGAPFAVLDLSDGHSLPMFGIQGSDGTRATAAVRELRAIAAERTRPERDD